MIPVLDGFCLPPSHPMFPRQAYQCPKCDGIFFPPEPPTVCPYCEKAPA